MKEPERTPSEAAPSLRERAEAALPASQADLTRMTPEEVARLVHELQVHQIELEMQNEELHRLQVEMDASRARYFDLYDMAPVGYLTVSEPGLVLEANFTAAGMLGVSRRAMVKQPFSRFITHADQDVFYLQRRELLETAEPLAFELSMRGPDGEPFWAHLAATLATAADGAPELRIVLTDINARKQAEERFNRQSGQLAAIVESSDDAIIRKNLDGIIDSWNSGAETIFGYSAAEMVGQSMDVLIPPDRLDEERQILSRLRMGETVDHFETVRLRKDGGLIDISATISPVLDASGKVIGVSKIARDITRRTQAEEALATERNLLRTLVDLLPSWIFVKDRESCFLFANHSCALNMGVNSPEELIGKTDVDFHPPEIAERLRLEEEEVFRGVPLVNREVKKVTHDGTERILLINKVPLRDADGAVTGLVGAGLDITGIKQAEEALRESEQWHRAILDSALDGIVTMDAAGKVVEFNPAAERIFGYTSGEAIGRDMADLMVPPTHRERHRRGLARYLAGGKSRIIGRQLEMVAMRRGGAEFPVELYVQRVGQSDPPLFAGFIRDITERKRVERVLSESEAFQRAILNSLPAHVVVLDQAGKILAVNEPWLQFARENGNPSEEEIGVGADYLGVCRPAIHSGDPYAQATVAGVKAVLSGEKTRFTLEYPCDAPGRARWFSMEVVRPAGDIGGAVVAHTDISERKQAEEALRLATQKLRLHFEQTPMAAIEWDLDFRVTGWNPAAQAIFGYSPEEAVGQHASFIVPEEFRGELGEIWQALVEKRGGERSSNANLRKDGTVIDCEWYNTALIDDEGTCTGVASLGMDVTDRRQAQQLLAWEKGALELIASPASPHEVLDGLMLGLEQQLPGAICSVLLLDEDGSHLRRGAAPSLPETFIHAIEGVVIGPATAPCGTAAYLDRQVIVEDIGSDPLWADYRELALQHGLHSCWSTPIHDGQGKVRGVFAIYHREPRQPVPAELELIARAVHVTHIAIERKRAEEEILQLNAGLERRVEQRTAELQAANASLTDFKHSLDEHALVAITDVKGTITYANDKFCEISKYSREELLGQNHRIVNSGYHPKAFFRDLWETILSGRTWTGEIRNRAKDGSTYWLSTTIVPFLGEDGKPVQFIAIRTDISERKQMEEALQESEQRLRLAAEAGDIAVWEWNLRTDELTWDARMFGIYGLPPNPQGRAHYSDWTAAVLPADLAEQEARLQHTIATCGRDLREFRIVRASDHAVRVIQASEMVITGPDGKAERLVGINFDSTESKLAEERIRELNAVLEIRAAAQEAANKELEAFSYSVSHDLRAPLRALDGFSRMVLADYAPKLDDEGRRMLGVIHSEAQRMGRLIDDLLAFSRLGRQPIDSARIDMAALARDIFDDLAALEPDRQIRLDLHPLPPALGTDSMIRQVWVNLIGNAVKFTKECEVAEIEIGAKEDESGGRSIYYVKDNGVGFDMRYIDKLFGVFQRLHSQQEFPGTGVGLALVQRIVQRHGGRVWAEAEVNRGATFYFTLPNQKS